MVFIVFNSFFYGFRFVSIFYNGSVAFYWFLDVFFNYFYWFLNCFDMYFKGFIVFFKLCIFSVGFNGFVEILNSCLCFTKSCLILAAATKQEQQQEIHTNNNNNHNDDDDNNSNIVQQ